QVENVIYRLNVQFSELKTIVEAHTGCIRALREKNDAFRVNEMRWRSEEEEKEMREYEKLEEELKTVVDIIELSEKYERYLQLTQKIVNSEDVIEELHERLDMISKKSRDWIKDVQLSGPAICEELMSVSVAVRESKKQYTFSIECLERNLMAKMTEVLVEHFQNQRVQILLKHREEVDAEALETELTALRLHRKRQPREHKYDQEEKQRELIGQRKRIVELRKHRNAAKYSREVALKNAVRLESELKMERSDLCIDVAFHRAALCKSLKKAHLSGAKVDDFTHSHNFTCNDIVLG
ncbi:hypothetical protein PFISCL1PPCAC_27654, partial [Pristionchus fissidentatus]